MASAALLGDARFGYTPPGGGPVTHLLAIPLADLQPIDDQPRFEWWSADATTRELVTIGGGVRELWGTIRMDNQPSALKTMLRAAIHDNVTVTYRETAVGTPYPCKIVTTESGEVALSPDRDRYGYGEFEVRVLLRRVDSGTFDGLIN